MDRRVIRCNAVFSSLSSARFSTFVRVCPCPYVSDHAFLKAIVLFLSALLASAAHSSPGDWPEPRQNAHLTAIQPLAGSISAEPSVLARFDLGRTQPAVTPVIEGDEASPFGLSLVSGALSCYRQNGECLWTSHPPGINFTAISATEDLNGDGRKEVLLQAGRPTDPYGAAVLVSLADGHVLWRYNVDPMSYAWYLYTGNYLPAATSKQIAVIMHGYPPDKQNGYIALFEFAGSAEVPVQKWRYDFDQYTCFPSFLQNDLDGDGVKELVVETHSRMWFLDAITGQVKHFAQWDVSPANVRSYGLVRFADLNKDGRDDFLCIANFAQHHEVLLNRNGKMEEAWHYGWPESVTTGKVASTWPEPPFADIDGDGTNEVVVSIYNAEGSSEWLTRVYDATTGAIEHRVPGIVAVSILEGGGILANACSDPTRTLFTGACMLKFREGRLDNIWNDKTATAIPPEPNVGAMIERGGQRLALQITQDAEVLELPWTEPEQKRPDFSAIPATVGPPMPTLLAANLVGDDKNEIITFQEPTISIFSLREGAIEKVGEYASTSIPVITDLNGDGAQELVTSTVKPDAEPVVAAITPSQEEKVLWKTQFAAPGRPGLPQPRKAYLRTGRFTGKPTPDIYVWAGTPVVRSAVLDGQSGAILWDEGETPGLERYWGPSVNMASVFDFDGDGKEDLVFTNPDYYCVASGPTGAALFGPAFPPEIFKQPSQGLYTLPALLENPSSEPTACLVSGHYFQGVMTLHAAPKWYCLPEVGQHAPAKEGFLRLPDGKWIMGLGRQNGRFACINVEDGTTRWELPIDATASDTIACDIDGDGQGEFIFGTSHGCLMAVRDSPPVDSPPVGCVQRSGTHRYSPPVDSPPVGCVQRSGTHRNAHTILWEKEFPASVGAPIAADVNGDGKSELIVCTTDGWLNVLGK